MALSGRKSSPLKENASDVHGRTCANCKKWKTWVSFDKKATGINGRDSRCKACIGKKKKLRREKALRAIANRGRTSVMSFSNEDIFETKVDGPLPNSSTLEKLLQDIAMDVILKIAEGA